MDFNLHTPVEKQQQKTSGNFEGDKPSYYLIKVQKSGVLLPVKPAGNNETSPDPLRYFTKL